MNVLPDESFLARVLAETAEEAGRIALGFFRQGTATTARAWAKAGGSPVTEADIAVDLFLKERLSVLLPDTGWLSEETADDPARLGKPLVWIVDPIDGTRAFAAGDPDWAVSIALVAEGEPVAGILHAPALGISYEAMRGRGARRNGRAISGSSATRLEGARAAGPKLLLDRVLEHGGSIVRVPKIPSLALRLARVADGAIELGMASHNAQDWDIAAADLILTEAGCLLTGLDGARPTYNNESTNHGVLVAAPPALHKLTLAALGRASTSR